MFKASRAVAFRALAATVASIALFGPTSASAQAKPGEGELAVGSVAPDFTIEAANASGVLAKPFKLSEHKGETVVLAFFPKARTTGCTTQMEAYRDQYKELMNGGNKVTLLGISTDADTALTSWSKDAKFPFNFGSDEDKSVGMKYGANTGRPVHSRVLYVIGPDGKIAYVAAPFKQLDAAAYTELGAAIDKASGNN